MFVPSFARRWQVLLALILTANLIRLAQFELYHDQTCSSVRTRTTQSEPIPDLRVSSSDERDLNVRERGFKQASDAFQKYLSTRQNPENCATMRLLRYSGAQVNDSSVLHDIYEISTTLVGLLIQSQDIILSLNGATLPTPSNDCKSYSCLFLPLTSCDDKLGIPEAIAGPSHFDIGCDTNLVDQLIEMSGLELFPHRDMLDWDFFVREAMRYVTRPSPSLDDEIQALRNNKLKPPAGWRPFTTYCSRVGIHMEGTYKGTHIRERFIKGLRIHAYSMAGDGIAQIIARGDEHGISYVRRIWESPRTQGDIDLNQRSKDARFLPSRVHASPQPLDLLAHAFILAEVDFFVGDFSKNFPKFVLVMMQNLRYDSFVPTFDVGGDSLHSIHFSQT